MDIFMPVILPEQSLHVHVVLECEVGPWPRGCSQAAFLLQWTFDILPTVSIEDGAGERKLTLVMESV